VHRAVERRVLDHDPHSNGERSVTKRDAEALVASGRYRRSTGSPASAEHWRRPLPDGSCLHLVLEGRRRRLHHDAYDPHASLLSLGMHATQEARTEAAAMVALAWSAIRMLAG
jgi:hypothetical protein